MTKQQKRRVAVARMLGDFISFGLCRQANAKERAMLATRFAELATVARKEFPLLADLPHAETDAAWLQAFDAEIG